MRPFQANLEEDLNRLHNLTLTEGQISTILYIMEGYLCDTEPDEEFDNDCQAIFAELEGVVDKFYDKAVIPEWDETKEDAQVNDVKYSTLNENSDYGVDVRTADDVAKCITNGNDYSECVDELVNSMEKGQ
tara:strand:+ start:400 stop:792 length:393 start_codon:yes stop_codon:yes gene_type:complete